MIKHILAAVLTVASLTAICQPKKGPKMAPVTAEGYYVSAKGDTVRGVIQVNPEDPTELYRQFNFGKAGGKLMPINGKKAKAYGYDNHHFIVYNLDGEDIFIERLATGRLNLFEYKHDGKIDGNPAIVSDYFAQDTRAEGEDAGLKDIKKFSTKFYKKDLKNYMKDQPTIWNDLDKFTFDLKTVISALNEFNKYYVITAD